MRNDKEKVPTVSVDEPRKQSLGLKRYLNATEYNCEYIVGEGRVSRTSSHIQAPGSNASVDAKEKLAKGRVDPEVQRQGHCCWFFFFFNFSRRRRRLTVDECSGVHSSGSRVTRGVIVKMFAR